jgi:hypothetical protein
MVDRRGFVTAAAALVATGASRTAAHAGPAERAVFVVLPPDQRYVIPMRALERYRVERGDYERLYAAAVAAARPQRPPRERSIWDDLEAEEARTADAADDEDKPVAHDRPASGPVQASAGSANPSPSPSSTSSPHIRTQTAVMGVRG